MGTKSWSGGVIRKTPVTPAGSYQTSSASGLWTMERVAFWKKQGLWPTAGNVDPSFYIENIFSTYLYTGTGATQTITNGIDLAGKGGLVWIKKRSSATGGSHVLVDTQRGGNKLLSTNTTNGEGTSSQVTFLSSGFDAIGPVDNAATYASWTFRKQAKFFDVVTYTGDGAASRTISHSLGATPGCMFVKSTSTTDDWYVYHRSLGVYSGSLNGLILNGTNATGTFAPPVSAVSSTDFTVQTALGSNISGRTYVAYLFAHDAGGFGAAGTDNVISCGSYVNTGSDVTVTLGWEPQFLLVKSSTNASNWWIADISREMSLTNNRMLQPNSSGTETNFSAAYFSPTATGFVAAPGFFLGTTIYIAIRRGPMKTPTSGTSVFNTSLWIGNSSTQDVTGVGFSPDLLIGTPRNFQYGFTFDKLRGCNKFFTSTSNGAETATSAGQDLTAFLQDGFSLGTPFQTALNNSATNQVMWNFRRAPGFLDVVCYTGTGVARTITHNLNAVPELMIVKTRSTGGSNRGWWTYVSALGNANALELQNTNASQGATIWNSTTPTSSVFSVDGSYLVNENTTTYVAYLFATVAGVSKVGSYTGTGTTQQINCGFTSSARFVLIKRTDTLGDWYVWDSARGIVAGNDPYLLLNSTAAEVTNTDYIDSYSLGFEISSTAPSGINANGGTYIFLAIA